MKRIENISIFVSLFLVCSLLFAPNVMGFDSDDISSSDIDPTSFSPGDNNGLNDTTTITITSDSSQNLYVNIVKQSTMAIEREDQLMTEGPSGTYVYTWNGKNDSSSYVTDGSYLIYISNSLSWQGVGIGTVTVNTTVPSGLTLSIAGGATYATSRSVNLTISATGATKMKVSNYANFSGATWELYSTPKSWQLTSSDGDKTVYINFKTASGANASTSDEITLDTTIADPSLSINSGANSTNDRDVVLTITANGATHMKINESVSNFGSMSWISIATTYNYTLSSGNGAKTVYLRVKDAANNQKTTSDSITVDTTPPTGLTIYINNNDTYSNSTSVTLALHANGGPTTMYLSNNNVSWTAYSYATSKTWTLSPVDGSKTVYFKCKDSAGNNATAVTSTITLDTTPPSAVTLSSPAAGETVSTQTPTFIWTNPNNVSKTRQFYIEILSGGSVAQSSYLNSTTTSYTPETLDEGVYTWRVTVYDLANNSATTTQRSFTISVEGLAVPSPLYPTNGAKVNSSAPNMIRLRCSEIENTANDEYYDFRWGLAVDNQNETSGLTNQNPYYDISIEYSNGQTIYWSVKARNSSAGDTAYSSNRSFTVDTVAPTLNSISINSGASYTNSTSVTATLSATGATWMMISESQDFSGASWVAYSASKSKTLNSGDGNKTLYFKAKDSAVGDEGAAYPNINTSAINDTIYLDTTGPTVSELSPSGGTTTTTEDLTVAATLSDAGADVDTTTVTMVIDGTAVTPTDLTTSLCQYDMPTVSVGSHWANVTAYDNVGNMGYENWTFTVSSSGDDDDDDDDSGSSPSGEGTPPASDKTITISRSPSVTITSSDTVTITATLENFETIVSINLLYSENDEEYDQSVAMAESSTNIYTATIGEFAEGTTVYYKVAVLDSSDTTTRSSSASFTVQDTTVPAFTSVTPANGSIITDLTPEIKAIYTDSAGIDTSSVVIKINGEDITENATVTSSSVSYTPITNLTYATYTMSVSLSDNSGNSATKTWSFTIVAGTSGITTEIEDIKADEPTTWNNTDSDSSIDQIEITSNKDLGKITLSVTTTGTMPGEVQTAPTDVVYMYLDIETNATDDISTAKINFKVTKQWITTNNIELSSVTLLRYNDSSWETLETTKVNEDDIYYYFEATTTGFSVFAITGNAIEETVEPLFPIIYLVIIVIIGVVIVIALLFKSGFLVFEKTDSKKKK